MSIFHIPLGMNVKNNPLTNSLWEAGEENNPFPVPTSEALLAENGDFLMTEDMKEIYTD